MKHAIEVRGLTRRFNGLTAVDSISFSVRKGEVFGLLGPNGAGKTTTINMLSTLLRPTSGSASVAGAEITGSRDDVRRNIGIVFQEPALDTNLTGRENLSFHLMLYGVDRDARERKINQLLRLVELEDSSGILVGRYSGGMKRRLEIARGLTHNPRVLFLDEPTLGLDAQTRRHIWEYIRRLNSETGVTIVLTTHYMEEADYLCDRVAIIDRGRIIKTDTPRRLKDSLGGDVIHLEAGRDSGKMAVRLEGLKWVRSMKHVNGSVRLVVRGAEKRIPEIIRIFQRAGVSVKSVSLRKPSLEEVFIHYTGKAMRDHESRNGEFRESMRRRMQ
jgi:ABC-2 type transport system ATP-binding protein